MKNLGVIDVYEKLLAAQRDQTSLSTIFHMFLLYHQRVTTLYRKAFCRIGSEGQYYLRLSAAKNQGTLKKGLRRMDAASRDF